MMSQYIIPCFYTFIACLAIGVVFQIQKNHIPIAALGGTLGWLVYLLCGFQNDLMSFFVAAVVISVFAEVMARLCKVPVTSFLTIAIIPMVPGGSMYYTMEYCIREETELFVQTGMHTIGIAVAIALGVVTVSSLVRMWKIMLHPESFFKEQWN